MPEVAQAPGPPVLQPSADDAARKSAPAVVEPTSPSQVVPGASETERVSIRNVAYDVPVALFEAVSVALRHYGPELLALTALLVICRYLLGVPALALGAAAGTATCFARPLISRLRH